MSENLLENVPRKSTARIMPPSKAALTRSGILDAASKFLTTHPFRDMTVGGLMAETGSSRSTFYQYFSDLHGLLETLLDEVKDEIILGAQPWLSDSGDADASLQKSLEALVDVGHEHGSILRAVVNAAPADERLEQVWETFLRGFDEVVASRISVSQSMAQTPEFDPLPVARALNRMNAGILIHAFGGPIKSDKAKVLSAISRIWLSTIYPFETTIASA